MVGTALCTQQLAVCGGHRPPELRSGCECGKNNKQGSSGTRQDQQCTNHFGYFPWVSVALRVALSSSNFLHCNSRLGAALCSTEMLPLSTSLTISPERSCIHMEKFLAP